MECEHCNDKGFIEELCSHCAGSGEGCYDGSTCLSCRGSGVELMACLRCDIAFSLDLTKEDYDGSYE